MANSKELPRSRGKIPSSRSPREHLKVCDTCGEIFNDDDPLERDHHDQPDHEPLLPPRA